MPIRLHATRAVTASLRALGLVAMLAGCSDPPGYGGPVAPLLDDGGAASCNVPDEGCACDPASLPVECVINPPVVRDGRFVCQHGSRLCRDGVWGTCENIQFYSPSGNKILQGALAPDTCRPDEYVQESIPDDADLVPANSSNLAYSSGPPSGVVLETVSTTPIPNFGLGADLDGDGAPDAPGIDDCLNDPLHWRLPCTGTITEQGFFHILNPGDTAYDPMTVDLTVKSVDAYILIDTTASMAGEITNLRSGLGTLMSNIRTAIPDAYLGMGMYREFPVAADGQTNDFPFIHVLDPTPTLATAQMVANQVLDTEGNAFWPEAGAQALFSVASGQGLGPWVPNRVCSNGGFGWPCFRSGTVPVVIVVTDAPFWNGASFATTDATRRRTELSHVPYPGTNGTTTIAGAALPTATTVSSTGQIVLSNDTAATAFAIGDITNRSVTVMGANNGATTRLANDFTETCGTRTPNGADVFYTFTVTQPRSFVFEAFGDFDPTLYLRRVSGATASTVACDLDSGRVNDGNGTAVWRTGAKIDTLTIPSTTNAPTVTNVVLSGCTGSSTDVATPMTNCSIGSTTTNVDLAGCTIPSATYTSNFSGCAVESATSRLTGCTVPSSTSTTLSGCTLGTTSSSSFTGCTTPTATTTTTLTGCSSTTTSSTSVTVDTDGCSNVWSSPLASTLSGCSVDSGPATSVYTGCSRVSHTPYLQNCYSHRQTNATFTNCAFVDASRTQLRCDRIGTGTDVDVDNYELQATTGITAGIVVTSHDPNYNYGGAIGRKFVLTLASAVPAGTVATTIVVRRDNMIDGCTPEYATDPAPSVGHVATGSGRLGGSAISSYTTYSASGVTYYRVYFAGALSSAGNMLDITSAPAFNQVQCSTRTTNRVTPVAGLAVTGTNIAGGATITSYCSGCAANYVFNIGSAAGTPLSSITVTGSGSVYGRTLTCTSVTGTVPTGRTSGSLVWSASGTNVPAGTWVESVTSATSPYVFVLTADATGPVTSVAAASPSHRSNRINCSTLENASPGGTLPVAGMAVSNNSSGIAGSFIGSVVANGGSSYSYYLVDGSGNPIVPSGDVAESPYDFRITGTTTTYGTGVTCTGANRAPTSGMVVTGPGLAAGTTTISGTPTVNGAGYNLVLSAAPTGAISTLDNTTTAPDRTRLTCNLAAGNQVPQSHWTTLAGTSLNGSTMTSITANGGASYTITMSPGASSDTASIATISGIDRRIFNNCVATSGPTPIVGDALAGMFLGASPTVSAVTVPNGMGQFSVTMNVAATSGSATLTTSSNNVAQPRLLRGCTLTAGDPAPTTGQALSGALIAGGATVAGVTALGGAAYDVTMSADSTGFGTTAATAVGFTMNRLVDCTLTSGDVPQALMTVTGTGLGAGATTISGVAPVAGGKYTLTLSQNVTSTAATATSATRTVTDLRSLTGCTITSGTLAAGMTLTGTRLAAGTVVSAVSATSPYTLTIDRDATSTGATTASGTLVAPTATLTGCEGSYLLLDGLTVAGTNIAAGTTITSFTGLGTAADPWSINLSALPTGVGSNIAANVFFPGPTNTLTNCTIVSGALIPAAPPTPGMAMTGALITPGSTLLSVSGSGPYTLTLDSNLVGTGATDASGTITIPASGAGGLQYPTGLTAGVYQLVVDSSTTNAPSASSPGRGTFQLRISNASAAPSGAAATTASVERSWASTTAALNAAGVKTIGIASCPNTGTSDAARYCDETLYDLRQLGVATSSVRTDTTPFVYQINEDGTGLTSAIADGVRDLAQYILFDVTAGCETAGSVACNGLFTSANVGTPSPAGQVPGCASCSGATCLQCTPGANLPYQITFSNSATTGIPQTNLPQIFDFFIVLRDATGVEMSRAPVRIVVPGLMTAQVQPVGSFTQTYDAAITTTNPTGCPYPTRRADWGNFSYTSSIPAGTSIDFSFRTADSLSGLLSATGITISGVTGTNGNLDIGARLEAAGLTNYLPYLRMTATLHADPTNTVSPVLQSYDMTFTCTDIE